jgi:amino acid transporter
MVAAEAKRPRIYIKNAFKTVYWRFGLFFIMGALCAGIVIPSNDPTLTQVQETGVKSAAASPYVIAMTNIVNALMVTSIFSAGNTYTYCATRSLYGLALEGRAPKVLRYCTKNGVPLYCFFVVMCFPCLSFMQLSSASSEVLGWLIE